ncbi:hypothetical protein M066_1769 [Bacteroides fragilis str. I1345]|nr:hypothetical protein M081_1861 [Bacteroides fragilis str. 3998 T(B) 4]EXZ18261.1 hypothetical protein M067_3367 [Bacteroides fragilis str. J-143-4]EYB19484.1 hypothetical protein M066_1769 [Bacteroides fragilis str. I1345]KXT41563.1 hypothetical protein HMPREF2534_01210 [Bacteroides thetaiotaomicron]
MESIIQDAFHIRPAAFRFLLLLVLFPPRSRKKRSAKRIANKKRDA